METAAGGGCGRETVRAGDAADNVGMIRGAMVVIVGGTGISGATRDIDTAMGVAAATRVGTTTGVGTALGAGAASGVRTATGVGATASAGATRGSGAATGAGALSGFGFIEVIAFKSSASAVAVSALG
jgi:hypothetical protein